MSMEILHSERLRLRPLNLDDADFIFSLVNEPAWLRYIGDKGVRTLEDARGYIRNGPMAMYARCGFGLLVVELAATGAAMGLCGLIRRDGLDGVDIGFAFLPAFRGQGYALEAAAAVLADGRDRLALRRLLAITSPDNFSSIALLKKLGFGYERPLSLSPGADQVSLFSISLP